MATLEGGAVLEEPCVLRFFELACEMARGLPHARAVVGERRRLASCLQGRSDDLMAAPRRQEGLSALLVATDPVVVMLDGRERRQHRLVDRDVLEVIDGGHGGYLRCP